MCIRDRVYIYSYSIFFFSFFAAVIIMVNKDYHLSRQIRYLIHEMYDRGGAPKISWWSRDSGDGDRDVTTPISCIQLFQTLIDSMENKKLCYGRTIARRACQYRKKLAVDEWRWRTPKVITVAAIKWLYGISLPVGRLLFQRLYLDRFQDTITFEVNVTACDLENSIIFDKKA